MRVVNCILAIYLVMLSCLPCADWEAGSLLSHASQEISSDADNHSHDTTDACSPFCVCSCCGSPVFVYSPHYNFSSFRNMFDTKVPQYTSLLTSSYFGSIWQPPQLNS